MAEKPRPTSRRRAAPSRTSSRLPRRRRREPLGPTSPLPLTTPSPDDDCDVDDVDDVCTLTHHHHQHHQHHIDNVASYVTRTFKVLGARTLIKRYGIWAVHTIALEFSELVQEGTFAHIQNPAGFFVWSVRQLAEGQAEAPHLRAVDEPDAEVGT